MIIVCLFCMYVVVLFFFKQLQGLENHLKMASLESGFDIGIKWPDLEVTTWEIVECIEEPLQSDGYVTIFYMIQLDKGTKCHY